jgi:hypothetical protein
VKYRRTPREKKGAYYRLPLCLEGAALHGERMGIGAFLVIHGAPSHSVVRQVESIEPNSLSLDQSAEESTTVRFQHFNQI